MFIVVAGKSIKGSVVITIPNNDSDSDKPLSPP